MTEQFEHEHCPKCGALSEPAEKVPDQTLRVCPRCKHDWFEDLNQPLSLRKPTGRFSSDRPNFSNTGKSCDDEENSSDGTQ